MSDKAPAELIDERIAELGDWRGETLARVRAIAHQAVPGLHEDWKWRGVPTFECDGIIFTGETYAAHVKLTFARGASLPDPAGLFNASLTGNVRRAIDIRADTFPDEGALAELIRAGAQANAVKKAAKTRR